MKNRKLLKQGLLISSALLLTIQTTFASCTNATKESAQGAAKIAQDDAAAAATAATTAENEATTEENNLPQKCKALKVLQEKQTAETDAQNKLNEAQKLVKAKCTGTDKPTPDSALVALAAAGAVVTIGGVAVVASSGSSGGSGSATSSSTNIDTLNDAEQYYVYHPVDTTSQNLIGHDNLSHLRDVLHSSDNKEHMGEHTNEAHSLDERGDKFKQAAIVTAGNKKTYNMTFIDAIGAGTTPQPTYLNTSAKVSGLYLQNTDLDINSVATLTADAVSVKKGALAVNGKLSVGAFLLDADATLKNGDKITFNTDSTQQIIDHMKKQLPDRYGSLSFGKFDLRGTVEKFTASKGMNVYLSANSASYGTFTHAGGTLVLSASTPIIVKNYTVSDTSILSVKWDQASQTTPLMTVTGTCDMGSNNLGINLVSIPTAGLTKDAKLTIVSATTALSGTRDAYKQDLAGGRFEFKTESNTLTVTCLVNTNTVAPATGLSATLSRDILGKTDGTVKGRFAAMEIPAAVSALDAAVSDAYLAPIAASAPSYFSIHQHSHTADGWNLVDESADATLTSMGFNAGQDVKLGFSASTPVVQTPYSAPTVGAHLLNNGVFMDAFYNGATQAVGSTVGYQLGMFSAGMTYMFDERSGVDATNPMGRLEVNNVHQHRILFNVGLNKRIEKMDFSATVFAEAMRYAQGYDLLIDGEKFHLNGHSFDRNCGANLQAKANFDAGFVSAAVGLAGSAHKVEPTTSVSFNFTY